ncbi:MAG TPA: dihydropteroate synthase [Desulfotomaculum sp.]|nr:dihydropteroate synthase [Desulfotomaculum sp.]
MRVISINNLKAAAREIKTVGADEPGCRIMAPKAVFRVVRISGLTPVQANILKQEMLSKGGEGAVSRGVVDSSVGETDVLLMGTLRQYEALFPKLKMQPFGLSQLGEELKRVLNNVEGRCPYTLNCRGRKLLIGERTLVMGILNVTPDSFSDGGRYETVEKAKARAVEMVEEGADIIDIGGESTRPGHTPVDEKEEMRRVLPVLEAVIPSVPVPVSVDTSKAAVARAALDAGAHIINDQWALSNEGMAGSAAAAGAPVILMHNQRGTEYRELMGDIIDYFEERIAFALAAGIPPEHIIIDPGIGFGKTPAQNLEVLQRLEELNSLGFPVLVGPSRKSFIGHVLGLPVTERLEGTAAAVSAAVTKGADIVRVHDVKEMVRVARMTDALKR